MCHEAQMNGRPYVMSRVGPILGGPAAVRLLKDPAQSALERLADTPRTGTEGRCFADLLAGRSVEAAPLTPTHHADCSPYSLISTGTENGEGGS